MRRLGFLLVIIACLVTTQIMADEVKSDDGQYTVVAPGTIHSQRDYNVAVAVHHTKEPVTIKIGFTGPTHIDSQTVELPQSDAYKQLTFKLPALEKGDYNLTAEGISGLKFHNTSKLNLGDFRSFVKVQTDKGKYKPGDIINYRVIFLDENLKPAQPLDDVVIYLEDAKRNRIKEIKNIEAPHGVYTGKFEISEFATLGSWNLVVQNGGGHTDERAYIEIEKYVLPKYSVTLDSTQQVSVRDGDMQVVVRANYTYGKPVNGKVLLNLRLPEQSVWNGEDGVNSRKDYPSHTMLSTADMVNGKAKFDLNVKEFADYLHSKTYGAYVHITATVEEDFTGVKLNETGGTQLFAYRYEMSCVDYQACYQFKADKEQEISFKITLVDGTLLKDTKTVVKAKFTEGINRNYGWYGPNGDEKNPPPLPEIEHKTLNFESHLNESSIVTFKVQLPDLPDIENHTRYYKISLEFEDETRELTSTYPYREPKKVETPEQSDEEKEWFRLEVHRPQDEWSLKLGQTYKVTLNSSEPFSYFVYNLVGRANLQHTERVQLPEPAKVHNFTLTPSFAMSPFGRMYVYYVSDKGEFRYAETTFHTNVELQNKIEIGAPEEVKPGAEVALEIKTEPKSFVGLLAVDQSVLLLGGNNDINKESYNWRLRRFDTSTPWQGGYSYYPGEHSGVVTFTNGNFFYNRTAPVHPPAYFSSAGIMRKTAIAQHTTTLAAMPAVQSDAMGAAGPPAAERGDVAASPTVRKNFVETWIFDNIEETPSKVFKWTKTIPDTITSWVLSAFSLHPEKGLGVTDDKTNIKTFQPFFVSVRLPYSVKRGEVINVPALVFNYLPKTLDVEVTLDNTDDEYDFVDPSNEVIGEQQRSQTIRVGANAAAGVNFLLRPKVIGNLLLKFKAISPIAGDALHKTLKVVPEGVTQYRNRAFFVNMKEKGGEFKDNFELELPEEYVKDSQHVEFAAVGDLLGPVIRNLEELIRLPSGCGEQTMSKMVPNYLVRDYLESIKKLTPELDNRIKRNLEQGYQNMLHYRHDDGSFSSFGQYKWREEDPPRNGSTWLTAYVLRSLSQIKSIVQVDDRVLESGYDFLLSRQADNGSFVDEGEYFYSSQRNSLTLTAKALLALLEHPESKKAAIDKAVNYLSEHVGESKELLPKAIAIYALQKAKSPEAAKHVANLKALANEEDDRTWWTESDDVTNGGFCHRWWCWVRSNDVEITSYAMLTILETESHQNVLNALRWLVTQRNSFGGFGSSQDTVMGLNALIKFAQKSDYEPAHWDINVNNEGQREKSEKIQLNDDNSLVLQRVEFPQGTKSLNFEAKGTGAALLQISYQYNVVEKEPKPSFKIETNLKPDVPPAKLELEVCVEYVEEGKAKESNMAILEVSLPSGFTADEDSFEQIRSIEKVRLVETKHGDTVVVIYFENLPRGEVKCIPIEAFRTFAVANQKPAPVVLYDYYDTNKKATEYYQTQSKLCDICEDDDCKTKC